MNQLTKLIEQYEKENPEKYPIFIDDYGNESFSPDFVALLVRLASRPTCGEEQRKFLDEVEKYGHLLKRTQKIGFAPNEEYDIEKVIKGE